jgi:hypothetical protein
MLLVNSRLLPFSFLEAIGFCLIFSFLFLGIESAVTLLIFDFLFLTMIFQLNGTAAKKLCLLTIGNLIGVFWNLVFVFFSAAGFSIFGRSFEAFYQMLYPFMNLLWIVSFWSLSLAFISKPRLSLTKVAF